MSGELKFVTALSLTLSNCSLYSRRHEMVGMSAGRALEVLRGIEGGKIELMVVDEALVLNGVPSKEKDLHGRSIVRRLARRGISWVEFGAGVTADEIRDFVGDIVAGERELPDYPHIRIGAVGVRIGTGGERGDFDSAVADLTDEQIDKVKEIYTGLTPFKRLEVTGLEEVVAGFIVALKEETNLLQLISPVKAYSEYTYTHATNVALVSLFLAESLGAADELLYDVGIAALMHDVGKLFISEEVLHKKGSLEKEEFDEMRRHPVLGAYYLAGVEGLTRLAPVAAFEHHRKFDGTGYPTLTTGSKGQHIVSQIVAVADFFDALRSNRPYREGWSVKKILTIMKENVGRDFGPELLSDFETVLTAAIGPVGDTESGSDRS